MKFRTILTHFPDSPFTIDHHAPVFLLGSCFAENMQTRMTKGGFDVIANPWGIIYNPESIRRLMQKMLSEEPLLQKEIIETERGVSSFLTHSGYHFNSEAELSSAFTADMQQLGKQLRQQAFTWIITLGTAWVYEHKDRDLICANCHKVPASQFMKRLLGVDEVAQGLQDICRMIKQLHPKHRIVFTLSPVRHLRDGFVENQHSKSTLQLGIRECVSQIDAAYFPAYELMMDDLRDYRFYSSDMLHPNLQALDYIWSGFGNMFFSDATQRVFQEVTDYHKFADHRVLSSRKEQILEHQNKVARRRKELQLKYPFIKFD